MIDHVGLRVKDYAKSKSFYAKALKPLGYSEEYSDDKAKSAGFGVKGVIDLWLYEGKGGGVHLALKSTSTKAIDAFYEAAIAAGAKDNGPPGPRPDYSPTYYAAFVIDPDGNNIEVVHA